MLESLEGVRRMLEGVRRVLKAVENCALYAVGTVGDALCAEVAEVMLKAVEVVINAVEVLNGVRCVLRVLGIMLCMLCCRLRCILEAVEGELGLLECCAVSCKYWKLCSLCWRQRRTFGDVLCATRPWKVCDVCWRLCARGGYALCAALYTWVRRD